MESRFDSFGHRSIAILVAIILISPSASAWQQPAPLTSAAALSTEEREAAALVRSATIRETTIALASDEMQGRGTAQPGGDKAAAYIADRFSKLRLKPLGDGGSYLQSVKFKSAQVLPGTALKIGDQNLKLGDDFVVRPPFSGNRSVIGGLVFVGYGLRQDLNNLVMRGKIAVLIKVPQTNSDRPAWEEATTERVIATSLRRAGIAGLIITNAGTNRSPYSQLASSLTRRRVTPADQPEAISGSPPVLLVSDQTAEVIFKGSGMTYAQAKERADSGGVVGKNLKPTASITVNARNERGVGANVAGLLEGSDLRLKDQAIVYSAHYDAFGVEADGRIYPGAADNALGVAEMIAIAEACCGLRVPPRRSVIFLALTGEEYGLLGAEHWLRHPPWKIEKVAGNLNFDGIAAEVWGPMKRVVGFGSEHSDLGAVLESVAAATGTSIAPDPMPEQKIFYRSDHYAFVKRGVPALMLLGTPDIDTAAFVGRARRYMQAHYHQPTDVVREDWNWDGAVTLAIIGLVIGMRVANSDAMPAWLPASPFNQPRGTNKPPPKVQ